jgi:hypothetical protein
VLPERDVAAFQVQEEARGTLVFVCPTTGHEVSTGVEVDRSNYKRLSRTKTAVFCPRCRKNHMLAAIWAWLVDEVPESPDDSTSTKSAAEIVCL